MENALLGIFRPIGLWDHFSIQDVKEMEGYEIIEYE